MDVYGKPFGFQVYTIYLHGAFGLGFVAFGKGFPVKVQGATGLSISGSGTEGFERLGFRSPAGYRLYGSGCRDHRGGNFACRA